MKQTFTIEAQNKVFLFFSFSIYKKLNYSKVGPKIFFILLKPNFSEFQILSSSFISLFSYYYFEIIFVKNKINEKILPGWL